MRKTVPFNIKKRSLSLTSSATTISAISEVLAIGALQGGRFQLDGNEAQVARTLQILKRIEIFEIWDEA